MRREPEAMIGKDEGYLGVIDIEHVWFTAEDVAEEKGWDKEATFHELMALASDGRVYYRFNPLKMSMEFSNRDIDGDGE